MDQEEFQKKIEEHANKVGRIYAQAMETLIGLASGVSIDPRKPFRFKNYARISDPVDAIFAKFYSLVYSAIREGIESEWVTANKLTDNLVLNFLGKKSIDVKVFASYFNHNTEAMNAFFARKSRDGGLNLSQKVWKYTGSFRDELEAALQAGIAEGKSAKALANTVRKYLKDPDALIIKSKQLKLDFFNQTGGKGVYRSAVQNALRLTRTETIMSYHTADHERWKQLDFVVGYEVKLSNNHPVTDVCNDFAGTYPKEFKFVSWHPQCRCHAVAILCTQEELSRLTGALVGGKEIKGFKSVNQVKGLPDNFHTWIEANKERATNWESLPYFLRDNLDQIPALKYLSRT